MTNYIYSLVLLLCVLVAMYYRNALVKEMSFIFWLVTSTFVIEIIGLYHLKVLKNHIDWLYDLFLTVEFGLMVMYFQRIISNKSITKLIPFCFFLIFIWYLIGPFYLGNTSAWFSILFQVIALVLCILCTTYLRQIILMSFEELLFHNPNFWITTGILFFYGGVFFQMSFYKYMFTVDKNSARQLYIIINHLLNILMYSLFTYGFICKAKYQRS